MTILVIAFEFPPQPGGIGTYAFQMADNFYKLKNNVVTIAKSSKVSNEQMVEHDSNQDFKIYRYLDPHISMFRGIYRIFYSLKIIKKSNIDVLFIANYSAGLIGAIAKFFFKIPYVITGHGTEFLTRPYIRSKLVDFVYSYSDLVIVNSEYSLKLLNKRKGIKQKNVFVDLLGADHILYDPNKLKEKDFKKKLNIEKKFVLLTVASVTPRKGHQIVIDAIDHLKNRYGYNDIHYLIIGKGPVTDYLEDYIRKKQLEDSVSLLGFVETGDLPYYYDASDLFILNSGIDEGLGDVEGFGIVLIEANLMNKPVIGTKNSGMEDAIDNEVNGLLIEQNNTIGTADAIKRFYDNRSFVKEIGIAGRKRALKYYTWEKTATRALEKMNKILEYEHINE